jgi:hypothetical protein
MKTKLLCITLLMILMCSGCSMCESFGWFCDEPPTDDPKYQINKDLSEVQEAIEEKTTVINQATEEINKEADSIKNETTSVANKVPDENRPAINPHLVNIKKSSDAIKKEASNIESASTDLLASKDILKTAEKKVEVTQEAINKVIKERDEAIEARDSALHKTLRWLIVGCIVGCGAFIVLFFYTGSKGGLTAAGGCGIVLIIAIAVNKFITYLAIGGGVLLLIMACILLYNIYIKNKAFSQVVDTVEVAQDNMSEEARNKIFGGEGEQGIIKNVQSKETVDLVHKEKNKMSSLWNYAKNKKG